MKQINFDTNLSLSFVIFFIFFSQFFCFKFPQDPNSQGLQTPSTGAAAGQSIPLAALASVAPILPFGITTIRDDSTESDQSLIGTHPQSEAFQRFL